MRKIVLSQETTYGIRHSKELESAAVKVQTIDDKASELVRNYGPESVSSMWSSSLIDDHSIMNQKWIYGSKGWKCVGSEHQKTDESGSQQVNLPYAKFQSMILQMMIWSQYEKIILFHPLLGQEAFYSGEELEIISSYFVPTYMSEIPLVKVGKPFKKVKMPFPVYQEWVSMPTLSI
ncbi:hypothetical protein J2T13_003058 [Paenibacillus sp. DS2015]|uniref:hypothetical protein n=1 Tax=Paenibacillus sp. DS2015 TaxID=3373917 RepID=UPI003D197C4C